ncbi:unnamed protein product [Toxocara canis]|uniref:Uncharacterized protein n=1 Tax=Toxocara canis TaxID=6265 RepID=A0A183UM64_TOXCA|nr:unnamed protein product [Toxocara canis]
MRMPSKTDDHDDHGGNYDPHIGFRRDDPSDYHALSSSEGTGLAITTTEHHLYLGFETKVFRAFSRSTVSGGGEQRTKRKRGGTNPSETWNKSDKSSALVLIPRAFHVKGRIQLHTRTYEL